MSGAGPASARDHSREHRSVAMTRAPRANSSAGRLVGAAGIVAGALLLVPGLYGPIYLGIVFEQWQMCRGLAAVALVATSYPADFCQTRDWIAAVGPGVGLLAIAVAGVLLIGLNIRQPRKSRTEGQ